MKIAINFMIILIILIGGYILPINTNPSIVAETPIETIDTKNDTSYIEFKPTQDILINPTGVEFVLNNLKKGQNLNVDIIARDNDDKIVGTINFVKNITEDAKQLKQYVDIDKNSLNLKNGNYNIEYNLKMGDSNLSSIQKVFISDDKITIHKMLKEDDMMLAYFSDNNFKLQVPIYRPIVKGSNEFRTIIQTISSPPDIEGILQDAIPLPKKIWFNAGVLDLIYDTSNITDVNKTSIIRTFEHIVGANKVDKIKFYTDTQNPSTSTDYTLNRKPMVYLPVRINETNEVFWATYHVDDKSNIYDQALEIFNKYKNVSGSDERKIALIPDSVELTAAEQIDGKLKLTFSKNLDEYYSTMPNYKKILFEGFEQSFKTIKGIDEISYSYE